MAGFAEAWERWRDGYRPIGYELRNYDAPHWARFHSLPFSKRYPETPEERALLLDRQNQLGAAVLGEGRIWLVQSVWNDRGAPLPHVPGFALKRGFEFVMEPGTEDESAWTAYAVETRWETGRFDEVLLDIAEDQLPPTLWMSASDGAVFAPYDGGVDLFVPTVQAVSDLKRTYADWLSPYPGGL